MKAHLAAFTLAEMMIALCGSTIVIGALLFSSMHLQRCLHSAEQFASNQADQRRLLDYVARDLRRAIGVASTTTTGGVNGTRLGSGALAVEGPNSLLITVPGYYQGQTPGAPDYDQPLPVVTADNYVDYGSDGVHAAGARVIFRKQYDETAKCICYVRAEENNETVIVREADNLHLNVSMAADGKTCVIEATYRSPHDPADFATEREDILLRNIRLD